MMRVAHLILALLLLVLFPTHAFADPVTAAIAAVGKAIAGFAASSALGSFLVGIGKSLVVGLLQQALGKLTQKKPKKQEPVGVVLETQTGDDLPLSFVVGSRGTAGKLKYWGTWGHEGETANAYYVGVFEVGSLPSYAGPRGLSSLWVGTEFASVLWEEQVEDGRGAPIAEYRYAGTDYCWVKYLDGSQTTADAYLREKFGSIADRPWTETMVGRGKQLVILTCRYNTELFSGAPDIIAEPHPLRFYDPRRDSSVGGSGPHRWEDQSTWEPSYNNAIVIYNIVRGIRDQGGQWVYGGQNLSAYRWPISNIMAAANECDRVIDGRPQYRCGAEISVADEPLDVIDALRLGCNGRFILSGGVVKLLVGAPGAAVWSFTDEMVIVSREQELDPWPSLSDTHNTITASYPDRDSRWGMKDAPEYSVEAYVDADRRWLTHPVPFRAVPYGEQVQALQKTIIEDGRRFRVHDFTLPPAARLLEVGDVISWTSSRNFYSDKLFIIEKIVRLRGSLQRVVIKELDPTDYDPPEFVVPPVTGWLGRIEVPTQPMTGWSVEPAVVTDAGGVPRRPAIRISCAPGLDDVAKVWVKVRVKETGAIVFDSDANAYASPYAWLISGGWMLPATDYEAQGRYIPYSSRQTDWSEWLSVTTPDLRLSYADLAADILSALAVLQEWINDGLAEQLAAEVAIRVAEVQQLAADLAAEQGQRVTNALEQAVKYRGILSELETLRDYVAENAFAGFEQVDQLRTTLTSRIGEIVATYDQRITTAVSDIGALAQRTTVLEASTEDLSAQLTSVELASVERDSALSLSIIGLQAGTSNQFDPARMWLFDTSAEDWTANPDGSVSGGFLRPGNGSDPHALSPTGLAISGTAYGQVRARIRKIGSPTWEGSCYWRTSSQGFDGARLVTISEPTFDPSGYAFLSWNMGWTGTIDQIRIDLSASQSATDYYEIDWIAIGSPSPGASRAELLAANQARASGDAALASSINALQALFQNTQGNVTALATAVSALNGEVNNLEDSVAAQANALTAINTELAGKATITALNALATEVNALTGEGLVGVIAQGQDIRAIRGQLLDMAAEAVDQDFANFLQVVDVRNALTEASQTLRTRIEVTEGSVDLLAEAITQVQVALPDLASAQALTALTTRVTATEASITATSAAVTSIQSTVANKADGSALTALTTRVTSAEGSISSLSSAVTSIQSTLPNKADASLVNSLSTAVSQQGTTLNTQGQAITSLQNSIGAKADASALNALSTQVQNVNGTVVAQGTALSNLSAFVGDFTAEARFRMAVYADGSGGFARLGLQARVNSGWGWREAGLFIDVPTDASPSRVLFFANQLAFVDNGVVPFAIDNGIAYLKDVNIERATIGTLQVGRSNIRQGAISRVDFNNQGTVTIPTGTWAVVGQTAHHDLGAPYIYVHVSFGLYVAGYQHGGAQRPPMSINIRIYDDANNAYTAVLPLTFDGATSFSHQYVFRAPEGRTQTTFRVDIEVFDAFGNASLLTVTNRQIQCLTLHRMP